MQCRLHSECNFCFPLLVNCMIIVSLWCYYMQSFTYYKKHKQKKGLILISLPLTWVSPRSHFGRDSWEVLKVEGLCYPVWQTHHQRQNHTTCCSHNKVSPALSAGRPPSMTLQTCWILQQGLKLSKKKKDLYYILMRSHKC